MSSTPDTRPAAASPAFYPVYSAVLLLTAVAAVALAAHAATLYHAGQEAKNFPPEVRRPIAFALVFNAVVAPSLLLAWLGEAVAAVAWLVRGRPFFRVSVRLLLTLLPCVVLLCGHLRFNPWLGDLVSQLRQLAGG